MSVQQLLTLLVVAALSCLLTQVVYLSLVQGGQDCQPTFFRKDVDHNPFNRDQEFLRMHANYLNETCSSCSIKAGNNTLPLSAFPVLPKEPLFYISQLNWLRMGDKYFYKNTPKCQTNISATLLAALMNHPRRTHNISEATYIFPDFETAFETNWPNYGAREKNWVSAPCKRSHQYHKALIRQYKALDPLPNGASRSIIFLDAQSKCFGTSYAPFITVLCVSAAERHFREGIDIGFPAPPVVDFRIPSVPQKCNASYLVTFKGQGTYIDCETRRNLANLHNGEDVQILVTSGGKRAQADTSLDHVHVKEFASLMLDTHFGIVARGNNLFSYRLMEVMSAGAIPIIFSDTWVLPFREVVNWNDISIRLPESEWRSTVSIAQSLSASEICALRRKVLKAYQTYFSSFPKMVNTVLLTLDRRLLSKSPDALIKG